MAAHECSLADGNCTSMMCMCNVAAGVQALSGASDLKFLGRNHSVNEALAAIDGARALFPRRFSFGMKKRKCKLPVGYGKSKASSAWGQSKTCALAG
jgi:hypothetical protein